MNSICFPRELSSCTQGTHPGETWNQERTAWEGSVFIFRPQTEETEGKFKVAQKKEQCWLGNGVDRKGSLREESQAWDSAALPLGSFAA